MTPWPCFRVLAGLTVFVSACSLSRSGSLPNDVDLDPAMDGDDVDAGPGLVDAGLATADASGAPIKDGAMPAPDPRDVIIGRYAEKRAFRTIQQVMSPVFNDDVRVLTTSYSLVEIRKKGTNYAFIENACRVVVQNEGSFSSLDVSIKDQVPQSIPQIESELRVEAAGNNITWVRPIWSAPVGFIPTGAQDVLPTVASDSRIRDSDGDGKPGVSANVRANLVFTRVEGTLYLAQWNRARYAGTRRSDGALEGENFDTSEQNVIGSDNPMLASNRPIVVADSDVSENRILLAPLAAPITCQTLLSQLDTLFP